MTIRGEVQHQQVIDARWGDSQGLLLTRFGAVIEAQVAVRSGEVGARHALRQALIDVASVAQLAADGIPRSPIGDE